VTGRKSGRNLTEAERAALKVEALKLSAQGMANTKIAGAIGVHRNTVKSLLDEGSQALLLSDEDKNVLRAVVFTGINEVKRRAYSALDARNNRGEPIVKLTSSNFVQLLHVILNADDRLVKLLRLADSAEMRPEVETAADRIRAYRDMMQQEGRMSLRAVKQPEQE
jgi:hypothetical protein